MPTFICPVADHIYTLDMTAHFYLVTYTPLVASRAGREACEAHHLQPFIDGSIRREPDLEHTSPSISCLCRAARFAPRLLPGDLVGYMTVKRRYWGYDHVHRRFTAVLQVRGVFSSHDDAASWYRSRNLTLPSNCMVDGNPPKPLSQSHRIHKDSGRFDDERLLRRWDNGYRKRSENELGTFLICDHVIHPKLGWDAPVVEDDNLRSVFGGKIPGTQNPGARSIDEFLNLMAVLGIRVPPSAP
ncbi:MAG TPA: hypothetical protein VGN12_29415 [Pirellulales bacterium]|jgi:hypothetical protein